RRAGVGRVALLRAAEDAPGVAAREAPAGDAPRAAVEAVVARAVAVVVGPVARFGRRHAGAPHAGLSAVVAARRPAARLARARAALHAGEVLVDAAVA